MWRKKAERNEEGCVLRRTWKAGSNLGLVGVWGGDDMASNNSGLCRWAAHLPRCGLSTNRTLTISSAASNAYHAGIMGAISEYIL